MSASRLSSESVRSGLAATRFSSESALSTVFGAADDMLEPYSNIWNRARTVWGLSRGNARRTPPRADAPGGPPAHQVAEPGFLERFDAGGDLVVAALERQRRRPPEGGRITAGLLAQLVHQPGLADQLLSAAATVPHVGVAGGDGHHPLLPRRPDPQRQRLLHRLRIQRRVPDLEVAPLEREAVGGEEPFDDLDGLIECVDPLGCVKELEPE